MFHRTADPGFEAGYDDFDAVRPHLRALTIEGIIADATAAHEFLTRDPAVDPARVAAIGYCMGGRCAFLANSALPLRAGVSYYGGGITGAVLERARLLNGPHLFFWGGKDTELSQTYRHEILAALDAAKKPHVNVKMSEAGHGFFCDERKAYHPDSAAEAWALTVEFLGRCVR
jgi:carboxymethylenebutenolidase